MTEPIFDKKCIPYPKKGLYWLINIPYLILICLTSIYLWNINISVSLTYVSFYTISIILHGYLCAFSGCPYAGTICPGIFGWFLVGKVALVYKKLKVKRSLKLIKVFFYIILGTLIGILTVPLYWLNKLGLVYSLGYFIFILTYFFIYILSICPRCAGRLYCPSARLGNWISKRIFKKDFMTIS